MKKLIKATSFHENRPVVIGDLDIWSKRLTGEEELLLRQLGVAAMTATPLEVIEQKADVIRHIVQRRVRDGRQVSLDWVFDHFSHPSADLLVDYLRTGEGLKPGEALNIPVFDAFDLDGRVVTARALSLREMRRSGEAFEASRAAEVAEAASALSENSADFVDIAPDESAEQLRARMKAKIQETMEGMAGVYRANADLLAEFLNARVEGAGEPITGDWLLDHVGLDDLQIITNYLRDGTEPTDDSEADTPNAADASA